MKYIIICNPDDFELCKQSIRLKDAGAKVEIIASTLVDKGKLLSIDVNKATTIPFDYIESEDK